MANLVAVQFAFRPTGSTTAALIDLLNNITELLQHNEYIVLFSFDFSKAFDSVKHKTLVENMELLDLPDHVFNWLVDYFDNRGHATRLGDVISLVARINASIIQGSVVGPPSYVIVASDLHPKHQRNLMIKYADDTYLMVVSNNIGTTAEEFGNIQSWAAKNNLRINSNKTKELIIFRRRSKSVTYPAEPLIPGSERVTSLRVLGAVISSRLTMREHLDQLISSCASSIFPLRPLRPKALRPLQFHHVARATAVASLLYASPAWWGFASGGQVSSGEVIGKTEARRLSAG